VKKNFSVSMHKSALAVALASGLALTSAGVDAAGLGRITVYSALGQPLRAEIQINATKDELASMSARLATEEAFRQASVERYSPSLVALRFTVEQVKDGKAIVKVSSSRPINDPFLDFLVELDWPSGRLVRQYTFLLDPPEVLTQQPVSPVQQPVTASAASKTAGKAAAEPDPQKVAPPKAVEPEKATSTASDNGEVAGEHVVKRGETLRGIAVANQQDGVSLEQMLVALYRNNTSAFVGKNMNLLRTGAVLKIPARETVEAISEVEARRALRVQTSEWQSYRRKVVEAPKTAGQEPSTSTRATGTVRPTAEPVVPPVPGGDQVQVSSSGTGKGATDEDLIATSRALKESQERVAILEKNIEDLKRLLDAQNQTLADLEKRAKEVAENKNKDDVAIEGAPVAPVAESVLAAPVAEPEAPPVLSGSELPPALPAESTQAVAGPSSLLPQPESALPEVASTDAPAPEIAQPKPQPTVTPIEDEFSEEDEEGSGLLWGGIGALVVVLALAGVVLMRRKKKADKTVDTADIAFPSDDSASTREDGALPLNESHSVFQETGGQSVDTSTPDVSALEDNAISGFGGFTEGASTFDAGDVDPVNEADLYLGYGKDEQAEEILLDALQKEPHRLAISLKLLEVYALRKNVKQFDVLAADVHVQTSGVGVDWEKVVALGLEVNPANPLYGGAAAVPEPEPSFEFEELGSAAVQPQHTGSVLDFTLTETKYPLREATEGSDFNTTTEIEPASSESTQSDVFTASVPLPDSESFVSASQQEAPIPVTEADFAKDEAVGTAFDFGTTAGDVQSIVAQVEEEVPLVQVPDLTQSPVVVPESTPVRPIAPPGPVSFEPEPEVVPEPMVLDADTILGPDSLVPDVAFDANLTKSTVLEGVSDSLFTGIDLDLATSPPELAEAITLEKETPQVPSAALGGDKVSRSEVDTKLELAQAYEDMGDLEGARELLSEVLNEGEPDQIEQAKVILERLGG
jgi:pilus assembly protein FimV